MVTVGYVDEVSWGRKGIDRFVDLARSDPERRFVLVGRIDPSIVSAHLQSPPPNLELAGFLSEDALCRLLQRAGTYVQLSWHEGFGVSMAEAMMAGCRPLISTSPALAEVAGEFGVTSTSRDHDLASLRRAIDEPVDRASMARWARSVTSMSSRSEGLALACFPPQDELELHSPQGAASP